MLKKWILLFLLILIQIGCNNPSEPVQSYDVAIYADNGTWNKSVIASKNMFEWMGLSVRIIEADFINTNRLNEFKILCFPGGDMYQYSLDISIQGKENIREFIKNGNGYIGICGGAYFASSSVRWRNNILPITPLALFKGSAEGPNDFIVLYPKWDMCIIDLSDTNHAITKGIKTPQSILYYWGPVLKPEPGIVTILGTYNAVNQPAMVAFEYGAGRVFLIGTHPEIEEDDYRDQIDFPDTTINGMFYPGKNSLSDSGSDWPLMKNGVKWLLK